MTIVGIGMPGSGRGLEDAKPGFVCVRRAGTNEVVGNGFLVGGGHIVTCAHVVAAAIAGCSKTQASRPDAAVEVVFRFLPCQPGRSARVIDGGWYPQRDDAGGLSDIAILRLDANVPAGARPLAIAGEDRAEYPVRLQPFVPANGSHTVVRAIAAGTNEFNQVQVNARDGYSQFIEPGISGAPVFHEDEGAAVEGMVQWRDVAVRQAFLCPAGVLRAILADVLDRPAAAAFAMDPDEARAEEPNRRLVGFDVYAPSQAARAGEGVAVQLDLSFGRLPAGAPKPREVELRLRPPRGMVTKRRGFSEPARIDGVSLRAKGDGREPYWRISTDDADGSLDDANLEIDAPPLCRLPEPRQGDELTATLVAYPDRFADLNLSDLDPPPTGDDATRLAKRRIIERLRLEDLGGVGETGEVVLGRVVSVVREVI